MNKAVPQDKSHQELASVKPVKSTGQTGRASAARDEQRPRVNSPKSNSRSSDSLHGFAQDFGDSRNTSWAVIAKLWSTKTRWIKRNRRISAKNTTNPRTMKTPKLIPFTHGFGRGIMHTSPTKYQRERSQNLHKKFAKKRLWKSPKRRNEKDTSKPSGTTPNHLYTPKRYKQGLACRPIILPSHKISPWSSQASPRNSKGKWKGKIGKQNELGFQEMAAILSPLGLYGGNRKTKILLLSN
jgi:hypothetical protein